jgi:hypothetical protein
MANRSNAKLHAPRTQPAAGGLPWRWIVLSAVVACGIGGMALAIFEMTRERPANAVAKIETANSASLSMPVAKPAPIPQAVGVEPTIPVDDDGQTLWASPTNGPPLELAYLPPGCQIIVALRPAEMLRNAEIVKSWAALGPFEKVLRNVVNVSVPHDELSMPLRILIGLQTAGDGRWLMTRIASSDNSLTQEQIDALPAMMTELFSRENERTYQGQQYWLSDKQAWLVRASAGSTSIVVAPEELIHDIIELHGSPPPLRRDIERLLAHTDADRPVTIVVAPNFLFGDGQRMFSGEMTPLREPLFWFLGDGLGAAALSMNWDENFFVELAAIPTLDLSPDKTANQLMQRVRQMPDLLEDYVLKLNPQPYGRRVVARFPMMTRKMATYTRSGVEDGCVLLRCYLPATAGHNLIMGAELMLAETKSGQFHSSSSNDVLTEPSNNGPTPFSSVRERLARKTSLSFARDSLEAALEQLSQNIGVEIIIVGPDLQADGITRNQQLGMHAENQPAADILVEILRKANPDKTATSAADARQKLVYVVKPKSPGGEEAVFVTTRARVAERGEELPAVFQP